MAESKDGTDFASLSGRNVIRLLEEVEGTKQEKPRRRRAASYLEILKSEDPAARSCDNLLKPQIVKKLKDCAKAFWETYDAALRKFKAQDVEAPAPTGTPTNTRDDEEAAREMLARLRQRLADTECDIDGDDRHARLTRETSAQRLLSELRSSASRFERLLEGSKLSSTGKERKEKEELLMLVAPFGQPQLFQWRSDFKAQHGVEPTVEDLKDWIQGKVEALDYVDAARRKTWSEAIGAVEAVTKKEVKPTDKNPMVGRGGDCEGCLWIKAALERRSSKSVPTHADHPCTCTTRPAPELLDLDQWESLLRTFDATTDKLKEMVVEYLRALKRESKLEESLRARAVFVVAQIRKAASANAYRTNELHPNLAAEAGARGRAAQRRAGLSPDRYCLAEGNCDPFSRRCRVVDGKMKTTRRMREWEDSKVDSDDDAATVPTGSTGMYDHEIGFEY